MNTTSPLLLNREQAERLFLYIQVYRRSALISMPSTQERNATLRLVQSLQGKLLSLCVQESVPQVYFPLSREEGTALKAMAKNLLLHYGEKPDSSDRTIMVTDVGQLYVYLKQTYR